MPRIIGGDVVVQAYIDPEWAEGLPRKGMDIWHHNLASAETLAEEVALGGLGGLIVEVSDEVYSGEQVIDRTKGYVGQPDQIVALSFGEDSRATDLTELTQAALRSQRPESLVVAEELTARQAELEEGATEVWYLPTSALRDAKRGGPLQA